jgi:hypothetical protein
MPKATKAAFVLVAVQRVFRFVLNPMFSRVVATLVELLKLSGLFKVTPLLRKKATVWFDALTAKAVSELSNTGVS